MNATLEAWSPRMLAVLRIVVALLFMEHGLMKIFGFPAPMGAGGSLPPLIQVAGWLETIGPPLLVLGLFTRPVAFLLSGEMAVAYFMAHAPQSFWPVLNHGEAAVLYCFVFLFLVFAGPGAFSLDAIIWKKSG
ncbi:MAG TPA: DoxX family protein [Rhizomicrobium sp.]|jgi:putative oxidoreductase